MQTLNLGTTWSWEQQDIINLLLNSDYQGEIKIMLKASGYHIIPAQTRIAQLFLLHYVISKTQNTVKGEGGFGSTDNQISGQNQSN